MVIAQVTIMWVMQPHNSERQGTYVGYDTHYTDHTELDR